MTIYIEGASVITIAVAVWFLGTAVTRYVPFLSRYNIPVSVTGGLLCSIFTALLYYTAGVTAEFDLDLRGLLLLVFFSTIGLAAKFRTLVSDGKPLILLVVAAFGLLILQNTTGVMMAYIFGAPPAFGLFAGSIRLNQVPFSAHILSCLIKVFASMISFRIRAPKATFFGFPAATNASYFALRSGL